LFLYGGHDSHIYPLLMLLNLDVKLSQPLYLSSLIVELRQSVSNSSDYYVQVYYKNNDYLNKAQSSQPTLMKIKGMLNILIYILIKKIFKSFQVVVNFVH
jgi:hypothetical protein